MRSVKRLVVDNLPSSKPELWANLGGVAWRRLSAWANTRVDPLWPTRPLIAKIEPDGLLLEVIPSDVIGAPIARFGVFEFAVTQLLRAYLAPGDVFADIGANIGYYSVIAGGIVGASGRVYAFEPSPRIRARLVRNVALNQMTQFIEVRPEAAAEEAGIVRLVEPIGTGNDGLGYIDARPDARGIEVSAVRLDGLAQLSSPLPTLIKVDVEGGEPNVFRGASGLLREAEAPSILFESFEIARDAAILREFSYEIFQPALKAGAVKLLRDLTAPPYRRWEAPNFLAVKSRRGRRFASERELE